MYLQWIWNGRNLIKWTKNQQALQAVQLRAINEIHLHYGIYGYELQLLQLEPNLSFPLRTE